MSNTEAVYEYFGVEGSGFDWRWLGPVHQCPACEGDMFHLLARFQDGEVAFYLLDGVCATCGCVVKLPTPLDLE